MRSSITENTDDHALPGGVGARHREGAPPPGGGGYLDNCMDLKFDDEEMLMRDLKSLGLDETVLGMAQLVGARSFIDLWRYISDNLSQHGRLYFPKYSRFERHQREKYSLALYSDGCSSKEIVNKVSSAGFPLSKTTLDRILRAHREKRRNISTSINGKAGRKRASDRIPARSMRKKSCIAKR